MYTPLLPGKPIWSLQLSTELDPLLREAIAPTTTTVPIIIAAFFWPGVMFAHPDKIKEALTTIKNLFTKTHPY